MRRTKWFLVAALAVVLSAWFGQRSEAVSRSAAVGGGGSDRAAPHIQVALLLDTSSSMEGLISQARQQLWTIINTLSEAKKSGRHASVQIALYEYGNTRLTQESGWIRQVSPLTNDLDRVSEQLFALTTNGGDEFCAQVIQAATRELAWSDSKDDLKLIFIAGNESFFQGRVNPRTAIEQASKKGIIVNSIHCGPEAVGVAEGWRDAPVQFGGAFAAINQNAAVIETSAPQDAELARLGAELNQTYIPYGAQGSAGVARQQMQERNAAGVSMATSALRTSARRSQANYDNSGWDIIDNYRSNHVSVNDLPTDALPAELRAMDAQAREAWVQAKLKDRERIQARIAQLTTERGAYVRSHASATTGALDGAMMVALRTEARRNGFELN